MMSKKKINPRRKPATQADIIRAKQYAQDEAISLAMAIFFTVLVDKEHADKDIIARVWGEVEELSDSIAKGYVNANDLRKVLDEEYDIVV